MRHLLSLEDLTPQDARQLLQLAVDLKARPRPLDPLPLAGKTLALLFEKPSLRTRVSFEAGMSQLGGATIVLGPESGWGGQRESVRDFSQVLSEYVDLIVYRSRVHQSLLDLAEYASCPVINGLTDQSHPCQALADLLTIEEIQGDLAGQHLTFVGDANNVARSLAIGCGLLGGSMTVAAPQKYQFSAAFTDQLAQQFPHLRLNLVEDPTAAVAAATAVYTDVWVSMGQEKEEAERARELADYQVNAALMAQAPADAIFLHCLPARRGQEVTDEVMDGPQSRVVEQAANRMHLQMALMVWLSGLGQ
jgi:ornithine carbamoyltransferase